MKKLLFIGLIATFFNVSAQVNTPQASPLAKVSQKVGLTTVDLEYSRPSANERVIFGGLVPFEKVWRTGANKNSLITFDTDVVIGGESLSKGTYSIYTIPNKEEWKIYFYSECNNSGLPSTWNDLSVVLSAKAPVKSLDQHIESFTISIEDLNVDSFNLTFSWEKTQVKLGVKLPTVEMTIDNIKKVMEGPSYIDYYNSANFYLSQKMELETALVWIKKATELKGDDVYWILKRQALIEAELGQKKAAKNTADRAIDAAKKAGNERTAEELKIWKSTI